MSDKKPWGSTVLGWFIVQDDALAASTSTDGPPPPAAADADAALIAAAAAAVPGTAVPPPPGPEFFQKEPPPPTDGLIAFDEVFESAGIDVSERERVGKAQQLLTSLPVETPVPVKKQIVEASLKAFGVPIDGIIEAGVAEIQALEGYIRKNASDTQAVLDESNKRIAQFEDEVKRLKAKMEQQIQQQQGIVASCNTRKLDIQKVLEFFGQEAVAKVVQASPRLHEPGASPTGG